MKATLIDDISEGRSEDVDRKKLLELTKAVIKQLGEVISIEDAIAEYEAEVKATEGEEGNPPAWVADESKWGEAKTTSQESYGDIRYPFVSWFYLNRLKGGKK